MKKLVKNFLGYPFIFVTKLIFILFYDKKYLKSAIFRDGGLETWVMIWHYIFFQKVLGFNR